MCFKPNGGYCVCHPSNDRETRGIKFLLTAYRLLRGMFTFQRSPVRFYRQLYQFLCYNSKMLSRLN